MGRERIEWIGAIAAVTLTSFGAGIAVSQFSENSNHLSEIETSLSPGVADKGYTLLPQIECDIFQLQQNRTDKTSNPDVKQILPLYFAAQQFYQTIEGRTVGSDGQTFGAGDPKGATEVAAKAKDHVLNGLCLAKNIPELQGKFVKNGDIVVFDGQSFNLKIPLEFHSLSDIVYLEIASTTNRRSDPITDMDIDDLKKVPFLPIEIEDNSFAIIPPDFLIQIVRMEKLLNFLELPEVGHIAFKKFQTSDPGGGWYQHDASTNKSYITITNYADTYSTVLHEYGHHIAKSLDLAGKDGGMHLFGPKYTAIREALELRTKFITPHEEDGRYVINPNEEYAQAFMRSVSGQKFEFLGSQKDLTIYSFEENFFSPVLKGNDYFHGVKLKRNDGTAKILAGETYFLHKTTEENKITVYKNPIDPKDSFSINTNEYSPVYVLGGPVVKPNNTQKEIEYVYVGQKAGKGEVIPIGWVDSRDFMLID